MKPVHIIIIAGIAFLLGAVSAVFVMRGIALKKELKLTQELTAMQGEITTQAEKIKELTYENIQKMSADDVITTYLGSDSLDRITAGADKYTKRIVERVFAELRQFIQGHTGNSP